MKFKSTNHFVNYLFEGTSVNEGLFDTASKAAGKVGQFAGQVKSGAENVKQSFKQGIQQGSQQQGSQQQGSFEQKEKALRNSFNDLEDALRAFGENQELLQQLHIFKSNVNLTLIPHT